MTPIPNALNYHSWKIIDHVARHQGLPAATPFKKAAKAIVWGNMRLPDIRRLTELSGCFEKSAGTAAAAVVKAHLRAMCGIVRDAIAIAAAGMVERTISTRPAKGPSDPLKENA